MPWINTNTEVIHKTPAESFYIGFDFNEVLSAGESIDTTKTEIKVYEVATMQEVTGIVDTSDIYYNNNVIIFKIANGEIGKWYLLKIIITTSLGNTYSGSRRIHITE